MLRRLLNDSNVNILIQSMRVLGNLAKGQKRYFRDHARQFIGTILSKFVDKKTLVLNEVHSTLDGFAFSLDLHEMADPLQEALGDKTPQVKQHTCNFIARVIKTLEPEEAEVHGKNYVKMMKGLTNDSSPDVRNAALIAIGTIKGSVSSLGKLLDDIPPAKMKKIDEVAGTPPASAVVAKPVAEEAAVPA
jgi:hypothetical protein